MEYAGGPIWAIDPATKTGFARGLPGAIPTLTVENFRHDREEEAEAIFGRAVLFLAGELQRERPGLIAIEAPVPPRQKEGYTTFSTSEISLGLNGIFLGIAVCKGIPVMRAHIGSWRKHALARGNLAGKEAKRQMMALCKQMNWSAPDDNAADAAGIWLYACALVAPQLAHRIEPLFARGAA